GVFEVEIASIADIEEAVTYKGDFQIEGVEANSWYTFQARKPEMSDISQSITRRLNAVLSTFTKEDLQFTDIEYLSFLEKKINKLASKYVIEQFGLEIRITNLSRPRTQQEKLLAEEISQQRATKKIAREKRLAIQQQMAEETDKSKLEELKQLREERLNMLKDLDVEEDDLKKVNKRIKALEKEALTSSLEDDAENILKPHKSRKALSLRHQFAESAKLEGGKDNPLLDSASDTDISKTEEDDIE
ncbi:MAG: hypothetical protein F6J92_39440, partial [Symploca sp. SIO1A3]|nr:hypothetical protein [Symploca sp. SIO1A3]